MQLSLCLIKERFHSIRLLLNQRKVKSKTYTDTLKLVHKYLKYHKYGIRNTF